MNERTILKELKPIIEELGHFPKQTELVEIKRYDLLNAISNNGGIPYFRELLGFKLLRKPNGYWRKEENIIKELKEVLKELGYFPTQRELFKMKRSDLAHAMKNGGGFHHFIELLGFELLKKPRGYWSEETLTKELNLIIKELGHFPLDRELREMNKCDLNTAITRHGGLNKFRVLMGYKVIKSSSGYWTEELIITELKAIIKEINHFPTVIKLKKLNRGSLATAISNNGGHLHFRKLLVFESLYKPAGHWTEESVIVELEQLNEEVGHFPSVTELREMNRKDLEGGIQNNGGINHFRELLGSELLHKPAGYWTEESVITELKLIIEEIGHFPTVKELIEMNRTNLSVAIQKHGNFPHFWEIFNVDITEKMKTKSKKMSYVSIRGNNSEKIVKELITKWCKIHNLPAPKFNVKLAKSKIIEFVCDFDKKIGIDVTNIEGKNGNGIRRKWYHKEYQNHLDELWIVVFNNDYNFDDYIKLNEKSPDNVKVMSIYTFIRELDVTINENLKFKIDVYNQCTFHTKRELKALMSEKIIDKTSKYTIYH